MVEWKAPIDVKFPTPKRAQALLWSRAACRKHFKHPAGQKTLRQGYVDLGMLKQPDNTYLMFDEYVKRKAAGAKRQKKRKADRLSDRVAKDKDLSELRAVFANCVSLEKPALEAEL